MSRKLAIKKLKASDLSFFQSYLLKHPLVKQKSFNLDSKVIEGIFFPSLSAEVEAMLDKRAPVSLTFFGPGGAAPYQLMRKILKQQKNWRLNGEAVHSPNDDPARYDSLAPEDIAVIEFSGASAPNAVKVVLLSAANPIDAATHAGFSARFPGDSMTVVSEDAIEKIIGIANTPDDHPIRDWLDRDLLEEVALGDSDAAEKLLKKRHGRGLSTSELKKAKANAEAVGRRGEELLDYHFSSSPNAKIASYEWTAEINAISPFDFKLNLTSGATRHLDAKSTAGPFSNEIHLSLAEINFAHASGVPYDICRLYNVREGGANFRRAKDIGGKLAPILIGLKALPKGVKVDSLSFKPDYFDFETDETSIEYPDE